jgi:hypothetical protein
LNFPSQPVFLLDVWLDLFLNGDFVIHAHFPHKLHILKVVLQDPFSSQLVEIRLEFSQAIEEAQGQPIQNDARIDQEIPKTRNSAVSIGKDLLKTTNGTHSQSYSCN